MKLLLLWVLLLTILYSTLGIVRHNHFQSGAYDLGLYDQAVWQYANFQLPFNTIKDRIILGDHLTLTLPLLAPLFYIWDDVRILLIFQAFWVTISSVAVFKIIFNRKFSEKVALIFALIYSLFYGIQYLTYFDFHPVAIGVGILPWLVLFFERKQWKRFTVFLALFLLTQENMGLALASLGLIYVFEPKRRKAALFFFFGGILASLLAIKATTLFYSGSYEYIPQLNFNPVSVVQNFFNSEEKRQVWLRSLSGYGFLPIFSPGALLSTAFDLSQYFQTGPAFARMWSPFLHHRAILDTFLLLGSLSVLSLFKHKKFNIEKISIACLIIVLSGQYFLHLPLNKLSKADFWKTEPWMENNKKLINSIPRNYSVASQANLVPHLSHRSDIRLLYPRKHDFDNEICGQKSCWWFDFSGKPEYLVVDKRPNQWLTQVLELTDNHIAAINNMEKVDKIKYMRNIGNAYLYKINY